MAQIEQEDSRPLSHYVAVIRRRLWIIILVTLVTLGAATAYTLNQEPVYRASMKVIVGQGSGLFQTSAAGFTQEFTQTMSELVESNSVATEVIEELDLGITPTELLGNLEVTTQPETAVIEVTYDDTNRPRAQQILESVGEVFTTQVRDVAQESPRDVDGDGTPDTAPITASVFDPAHLIPGQVEPKPLRDLAVATALGLLLGVLAAFVREQFDDTIRSIADAETAFGQSATASMPPNFLGYRPFAWIQGRQRRRRRAKRLDPVLAELALQRLRASILWSWGPQESRSLVVTSAHPEEGKTTVAANLAASMAKDGADVILVDADLRRPLLHNYLGVPVGPETVSIDRIARGDGLVEHALIEIPLRTRMTDEKTKRRGRVAEQVLEEIDVEPGSLGRLRVVLAAPGQTWPSEFGLERTRELIDELRRHAEYVIFDAPPILVVTDSYPLVAACETVIAVVRNAKSTSAATNALSRTLGRLRVRAVRRAELVVTEAEPDFSAGRYGYYQSKDTPAREPTRASAPPPPPQERPAPVQARQRKEPGGSPTAAEG